jgi:hypothetical protein
MSTIKVIVDTAPLMKVSRENLFLDIGLAKYLDDIKKQGVCIAEVPADDFWVIDPQKRYHRSTEHEAETVKNAKIVNETYQGLGAPARRELAVKEAAEAALSVFEASKKKVKKQEPHEPKKEVVAK